jgi:hypothetical protein
MLDKLSKMYLQDNHGLEKSNKLWWLLLLINTALQNNSYNSRSSCKNKSEAHLKKNSTITGRPFNEFHIVLAN